MSELEPCPFCGGSAESIAVDDDVNCRPHCWIYCTECQFEVQCCDSANEAREAWNRRALDKQLIRELITPYLVHAGCSEAEIDLLIEEKVEELKERVK